MATEEGETGSDSAAPLPPLPLHSPLRRRRCYHCSDAPRAPPPRIPAAAAAETDADSGPERRGTCNRIYVHVSFQQIVDLDRVFIFLQPWREN